jgi:hypothetical protein
MVLTVKRTTQSEILTGERLPLAHAAKLPLSGVESWNCAEHQGMFMLR